MALDPAAFSLAGRVAVVTGAAKGIGAAIASALAVFGADVALCDRDEAGLDDVVSQVQALGRRAIGEVLDVRDATAVHRFAQRVGDELAHVEAVVNNAGGGFEADFLELSANAQDALVRENFTSVAEVIRAFVPLLPVRPEPAGSGGSIVNITSIEAHRAGPGFAVYSAMKAAVENLTKSLALELADRHVRVNCIAPDMIPTPGIGVGLPVSTPLPYAGRADDVAAAAVFLVSPASRFVTGTTVHVDGGNSAAGGWRRGPDGAYRASG